MSNSSSPDKTIIAFAVKYGGRECIFEQEKYIISGYTEAGGYNSQYCKVLLSMPEAVVIPIETLEIWRFVNTSNREYITHGTIISRLNKIKIIQFNKKEIEKIIKALEL